MKNFKFNFLNFNVGKKFINQYLKKKQFYPVCLKISPIPDRSILPQKKCLHVNILSTLYYRDHHLFLFLFIFAFFIIFVQHFLLYFPYKSTQNY